MPEENTFSSIMFLSVTIWAFISIPISLPDYESVPP